MSYFKEIAYILGVLYGAHKHELRKDNCSKELNVNTIICNIKWSYEY